MTTAGAEAGIRAHAPVTWSRVSARGLKRRAPGVASLLIFLAIWQIGIAVVDVSEILVPRPLSVWNEFLEVWKKDLLWPAIASSLHALSIGLVLALSTGVIFGLIVGSSRWLDLVASPYLWGFFATPRIAMAPLVILWLGFGTQAKVLLVFLSALLPVLLQVKEGVQTVDESLVRAARSFGAGRRDLFVKVVVPYTLPFIATALRQGVSRGFVGLLIIEMTVGSGGIGTQVMRAMRTFNSARMFAFIAVLVVTALVLISLSRAFERFISRWREEVYV
jgi:ABC-type nitrate/sulfonate/bicarbonate transport system permease component